MSATVVWVTGASQGLGRALVERVPFDDATVFDVSRRGGLPGTTHVRADLADPSGWVAVEAHLRETLSGFDGERVVFIHCAGTLDPMGFAAEVDTEGYRRQVLLNSAAPQVLGQALLSAAADLDVRVDFVQLTSGAASKPYQGWTAYCAGKAAGDHWVRTAGAEQAVRGGARVLAVAPGRVDTAMQAQLREQDERDFPAAGTFREAHAKGELTDPADAAERIWKLLGRDDLDTGSVLDLRSLA
jgi:NAD(P)-dependent dehydrogenase (short-subunit alcohol dehydrogenase family)